jgi:iron transport multicopper oxidase
LGRCVDPISFADAAAIYVWHNGSYYPSAADIASGAAVNDNATIPFEAGKKYRIRIINMSALAMFFIGIDGHDMSVIETDGVEITPYPIDTLTVAVAQRYSILVEAKNDTSKNYAITVMQSPDM